MVCSLTKHHIRKTLQERAENIDSLSAKNSIIFLTFSMTSRWKSENKTTPRITCKSSYVLLRKKTRGIGKMVSKVLTRTEEKLLQALKQVDTVGFAAQKIGIKTKTAYNILYRLRKKYYRARRLVNSLEPLRGHYDLLALVLTDRRVEAQEKKESEFEEEESQTA